MVPGLATALSDGVLDVRIARGDKNLLTTAMCEALTGLLTAPPEGAHILRLSASGPSFCLGRERVADRPADLEHEVGALIGLNQAFGATGLVTVAEVQGDAAGFGVGLAALCDVAIATRDARFWFPEATIDLAPVVVLVWLPRIVGRKEAFRLAATGQPVDAWRAAELGLITDVVLAGQLRQAVDEQIADLRAHAPRVHREIREFLAATAELGEDDAYELARQRLVAGSLARRRDRDELSSVIHEGWRNEAHVDRREMG
jgi:enoyl-CoA hydratase/carnithine racemase